MSCPMRPSSRVVLFVLLLVGGGQMACASPPRIEALQPTRTTVATLEVGVWYRLGANDVVLRMVERASASPPKK